VRVVEEREDKFEVDPGWVMPHLNRLVPDGGRLDQEVRTLDNTYFDTPGAGLRLFGVTLRRRVGGSETGWQLKVPSGTARTELQSGSRTKTLPPVLAKSVAGLRAGGRLDPVARMKTTERPTGCSMPTTISCWRLPMTRSNPALPMPSRRMHGVKWKLNWGSLGRREI
jgi:hypothetical protein